MKSRRIDSSDLKGYLRRITYPAKKEEIVNNFVSMRAPPDVMNLINRIREKVYGSSITVEAELGKLK